MKKTMKKILCTLLVVVMCLTSAPLQGFVGVEWPELPKINFSEWFSSKAEAANYNGSCGDNLAWSLDTDTGVLTISGSGAMWNSGNSSSNYAPWYSYRSSIKTVVLSYGLTTIGAYAFYRCTNLEKITIPDSVKSIYYGAFYSCDSLTYVTIPNSVTSIGFDAFFSCGALKNVTIGDNVISIGMDAFRYCTSLESVIIPDSVTSIDEGTFCDCNSLTNVIIGDGVASIGYIAFSGCYSLLSVRIGDSVTSIEDSAFGNCSSLIDITIPDSVTSIGGYAFNACKSLTSVTIGDGLTTIGDYAFYNCYNLTSITPIPDSVASIGRSVFDNTAYYNNGDNWQNNVLYIGNHLIKANESISDIYTIKKGTKSIAKFAFYNCDNLTGIIIPNSITSINYGVFKSCDNLADVKIPDSVTSVGDYAFSECGLKELTIPVSVEFDFNTWVNGIETIMLTKGTGIMYDYGVYGATTNYQFTPWGASVKRLILENGIKNIGVRAFCRCSNLNSIIIPDSVTTIGASAFHNCTSLTDVYYEGSETEWNKITIGSNNTALTDATIHYNCVMPDSGEDDDSSTSSENFQFSFESYSINMGQLLTDKGVVTLVYKSDKETISNFNVASIDFEVSDNSIFRFKEAYIEPSNLDTMVKISCWVEGLKLGSATLTATLPDGTTASCEIEVTEEKINDGEEEEEVDNNLINTEAENDAFVQQHLIFRKAYYDYFTKNLRWASEIWNHMDTAATLAAELAYDIIEGALEIVSLKFLDGLEVAANPYDVILLDFLASNISQSHFAKNAKEDALTVAVDIVNKAIKIFSDDSKWDPDFDIKNEVKLLITSSDYSQNNLYLALDNLHDGDYSDKITKIFNGFDCFGQVMKAVTAGAKFADMFVELLRYTVAIESFYNSTAVFKSVLDAIATEMEVNNPVFASYFANALEFYEESLTYDSIVEYVIKNKGVGDTAKLIYDMSTNVISDATVSFIMKAFKVGKDVARKVNAALWSAEVGWGLSNLLTGNNVSIGCRRMLRATYALDVATYNVMERFGTILDRDESYGAALCFDSSFNIFKMTQLYSLEQYKKYCENMATRPFTFNKSEFKNADEFLTAATVTWKDINCHYVGGSSSFRTSRVDTLRVACPTDVYVYRKADNKLVASVINNKSKLYDDSVAILCIDGEKSFAATDMDDYRIEIKATDNGTMDVIYNSYSDFKNTKKLSFDDVPIKSGNKYELDDEKESIKRDDNVEYKTDGRVDNCSCNCHKGGIAGFFFKIILFFQKIFKTNKTCSCGVNHY